jgi:phytanoyl-CoA hydroxylase
MSERESFDRDGFVIFRDVIDKDLVAEASAHVDWLERRNPDLRPEHLGHWLARDDPFWVRLISDDRLLDLAELFIGPDIGLFATHYISKPPFTGQPVLWHQDSSYWPLDPMEVVTVWLAVDDSTRENGCMRVVPGTHRGPVIPSRPIPEGVDAVLGLESDTEVDESAVVDLVLAAGDCEVHHPGIMHSSEANTSPKRRCGLTIRYIPTSTRIITDVVWDSSFHLRGQPGVNRYQPFPRYEPGQHHPFAGAEEWNARHGLG